jgi:molybdate transport system substrate-binding protein
MSTAAMSGPADRSGVNAMTLARWIGIARAVLAALTMALLIAFAGAAHTQERLVIFAAASLKNAMDDVAAAYTEKTGVDAVVSYAGSSALARQIEQGAPADVFVSANLDWMDYLSGRGLTDKASEIRLLGNRIVLVAQAGSDAKAKIAPGFDLAGLLGEGRLAMANTDAVPAGVYGKAALEALGIWDSVGDKVAQAENVRAALALVSTGEAPLGIVYRTDAAADDNVRIVDSFPEDTHPPIVYPAAVLAASENPAAADFLKFLQTSVARGLFEAEGFAVLVPPPSN